MRIQIQPPPPICSTRHLPTTQHAIIRTAPVHTTTANPHLPCPIRTISMDYDCTGVTPHDGLTAVCKHGSLGPFNL